jgi:hypothetical protein
VRVPVIPQILVGFGDGLSCRVAFLLQTHEHTMIFTDGLYKLLREKEEVSRQSAAVFLDILPRWAISGSEVHTGSSSRGASRDMRLTALDGPSMILPPPERNPAHSAASIVTFWGKIRPVR